MGMAVRPAPPRSTGHTVQRSPPTARSISVIPTTTASAKSRGPEMPDCNPRTVEEARAFVAHVESLFMPWSIDGLLAGFTDDCIVKFGDLPELRGKAALEKLFRSRMERQKDYRLFKEFRALMGDQIANYCEGWW